jgi:diguanylate cyclase (GGDEF)-like protein
MTRLYSDFTIACDGRINLESRDERWAGDFVTRDKEQAVTNSTVIEILQEDRSLFSSQFALGFRSLSFIPELESRFRQFYLEHNPGQLKRAIPIALVLTLLFSLADYLRLPPEIFTQLGPFRMAQLVILLVLTVLVFRDVQPLLEAGVILALAVYGITTPIILGIINAGGEFSPISAHLLILCFGYFLSGLRFYHAMFAGLIISLAYPASQALFSSPLPNLAFNCFMIIAFNVLGLCGAYFLEYTARENYLSGQLLSELALFDGLTGLLNRRAFGLDLEKICRQAKRGRVTVSLGMVDVDHFKEFNDYFGHVQGDHCLRKIAGSLRDSIRRPLDKVGRYGGEEFILVWYDCNEQAALEIAEAARKAVEALAIPHGPGATQRTVTISIGVATGNPREMMDSGSLIRAADRALYEAKSDGRNRVTLATDRDLAAKPR